MTRDKEIRAAAEKVVLLTHDALPLFNAACGLAERELRALLGAERKQAIAEALRAADAGYQAALDYASAGTPAVFNAPIARDAMLEAIRTLLWEDR